MKKERNDMGKLNDFEISYMAANKDSHIKLDF
jgi:hypothetical protein